MSIVNEIGRIKNEVGTQSNLLDEIINYIIKKWKEISTFFNKTT